MAGPDFTPRRHRQRHRSRPAQRGGVGTNWWLMPVMVVGFVAALATFHYFPGFGGGAVLADGVPTRVEAFSGIAGRDRFAAPYDTHRASFGLCHSGGGNNCVVDGDTFWFAGEKYRIADIDTPETHPARCAEEAALGEAATGRLRSWLNDGAFSLENIERDADRYGRKLRVVTRDGTSVGSVLVAEGLARRWKGQRRLWC